MRECADQERAAQAAADPSHEKSDSWAGDSPKRPEEHARQAGLLQQSALDLAAAGEAGPPAVPQVQTAALGRGGLRLGVREQEPG